MKVLPSGAFAFVAKHSAALLLCALFFFAGLMRLNDLSLYTDSDRYVIWGTSLAHGNGFVDGIVSDRKVSAGDTAQIGKEMLKVIDPNSMRFEALVAAEHVGIVKAGQAVHFRVNGYGDQEFAGKVRRVNPAANPTTRQVEVLVDFVGDKQPKLAGLYAEGRLETASRASLTIPATAVVRDGDNAAAWRVKGDKLQKVTLAVEQRDARTGDYVLKGGLAEGDQVIRHPNALLKEGQSVQAAGPAKSSMVSSSTDGASQPQAER